MYVKCSDCLSYRTLRTVLICHTLFIETQSWIIFPILETRMKWWVNRLGCFVIHSSYSVTTGTGWTLTAELQRFGPEYVGWRDVPSEELRHKVTVCVFRERNPHPTRPRPRSGRGSRTAWGWWRSEVNTLLSDFSVCCLWYPPLVGLCVCSQTPRLNTQTPLYILRRRKQIGK